MSERTPERRFSARAAVELPIEYERLNALLSDYTHNISRGGTFIRTDQPLPVGTVLSFTIVAPKLENPLVLRGSVQWIVHPEESAADRPAGMGIAFVFGSPDEKARFEARLDRLMVETLGRAAFEKLMGKPAPTETGGG
jgi:type IV pilus assembly protein PilZ